MINLENSTNNLSRETKTPMETMDIKKLLLASSIPAVIGMSITALYNTTDRFWVSQIPDHGSMALAGVGLCAPIIILVLGFSQLIGLGSAACISISLGRKDKEHAEKVLGNALTLSIIISLIVTVFGLLLKDAILYASGASQASYPYANEYITIFLLGSVFNITSFSMNHPIRATGNVKRFAMTLIVGAVCNMILDPILIIYLGMGVKGAALASVISMAISMILAISFYFNKKSILRLRIKNMAIIKTIAKDITSVGFSPFLSQVAASVIAFILIWSVEYYGNKAFGDGDLALSSMTIITSMLAMLAMPLFGINQGAQPIIGYNFGAGNYKRLKDAYKWSLIYALIITSIGFVVVEAFAPTIASLFANGDQELIDLTTSGLRIVFLASVLIGFQIPTINFFTAIKRPKISIILNIVRQILILTPLYLFLPMFVGFNGIWLSNTISEILGSALALYFVVKEFKRLKELKSPMKTREANHG